MGVTDSLSAEHTVCPPAPVPLQATFRNAPKIATKRNESQSAGLALSMLSECLIGERIEPPRRRIVLDVAVPNPCTNLRQLFLAKLFNRAFDFLDGAHIATLFQSAAFASRSFFGNAKDVSLAGLGYI